MLVNNISRWKRNCVNHLDSLSFGQRVHKTYFIYCYVNYTQRARVYSSIPVLQTAHVLTIRSVFQLMRYKCIAVLKITKPLINQTNIKVARKTRYIQLNFVKANFIKTNNSLRRSKISVPNRVLLILTKIQLVKSKYLCRTFYVSKHIFQSRSGVFFIKSIG